MNNQYYAEMLNKYILGDTCSKHAAAHAEEPAVSGKGCRVKDADGKEYMTSATP